MHIIEYNHCKSIKTRKTNYSDILVTSLSVKYFLLFHGIISFKVSFAKIQLHKNHVRKKVNPWNDLRATRMFVQLLGPWLSFQFCHHSKKYLLAKIHASSDFW